MADNLGAVAQLLEASLDPRQNKQGKPRIFSCCSYLMDTQWLILLAELALRQEEQKPGYSLQLLQITASGSYPYNTRLASALCFKNFIKRNYTDEDGNYKLQLDEVTTIKQELISLMISVPAGIQSQLGEAVSVIADSDFWERWDTLVDGLDSYLEENKTNKDNLVQGFTQFNLMIKLLYDLSCHDLPPMFEEQISGIATLLLKYLTYDNQLLHTDDDTEAGQLEFARAGIFEVLTLWVQKYIDEFKPHVEQFVGSSWSFLATIGQETKYDILVSRALQFLTSIAGMPEQAAFFQDENTLSQVIEKVILPNVSLRESDEELFEDEPIEFIRRDLEGSDSETRRRAATDFLRKLAEKFESSVTKVVLHYTEGHLAQYTSDPASNWKAKDTATYLFSAIAAKGVATTSHGVTATNSLVSITDYLQKHLAADLVAGDGVNPILKVDAIKYLYTFRSIITKEQWQEVLPLVVNHLGSSNYVVYSYAAIAVERALYLTDNQGQPIIAPNTITPLAKDLLEHIFALIQKDPAPEKVQENEFLMKCAMRVLIVIKEGVVPHTDSVLQNLINITEHRFAAPANPDKLEQALYPPFAGVLQGDVQGKDGYNSVATWFLSTDVCLEFMPYIFQLFAALLEANPSGSLPNYYQNLVAPILMPVMWESKGNIPALVRLLSSIIARGSQYVLENQQLSNVLGIFQKLLSTKANESYGFDLLESVVANFPPLFTPIYLNIILPDTQKLARPLDRKTAVLSFTKTLANSDAFANRYKKGWGFTCEALLKLLELPPLPASKDDIIVEHDVEDMAFGVGFTALNTVRPQTKDPWPETGADLKAWVGQYLKEADKKYNGRVSGFAQERLSNDAKTVLGSYIA
ncbi:unnamed protein product [Aspergillus oryzae]|uniref:Unnamed protein product n=1 Tax=Aspergillus oryzae TaxID=5062 RepID=A0AAN5C359_ASPOZ|nr:unnamed protein product [Aspergillus oryzae]GMF91246.1 unnamed protein product [Aspergillus oryzae]GMG13437.1 unnamed protein product [Aspergillus oryzae]GMG35898.1 unnamed protein product [Aspergillus oryzae]